MVDESGRGKEGSQAQIQPRDGNDTYKSHAKSHATTPRGQSGQRGPTGCAASMAAGPRQQRLIRCERGAAGNLLVGSRNRSCERVFSRNLTIRTNLPFLSRALHMSPDHKLSIPLMNDRTKTVSNFRFSDSSSLNADKF